MNNPKVSVIISTYNRPQQLQRALDSVFKQTYQDFEIVVVDDCSTKTSEIQVPSEFKDRFTYVKMPFNTGHHCRPKNVAIMCSKGDYICYLDDDNVFMPNHIQRLVEVLEKSNADVVYGDRVYRSSNPNETKFMGKMSEDYSLKKIEKANFVDTSDIMHTKQAINDIGYWDVSWRQKSDWMIMTRFGKAGKRVVHVPEDMTEYWWSDDGIDQRSA